MAFDQGMKERLVCLLGNVLKPEALRHRKCEDKSTCTLGFLLQRRKEDELGRSDGMSLKPGVT